MISGCARKLLAFCKWFEYYTIFQSSCKILSSISSVLYKKQIEIEFWSSVMLAVFIWFCCMSCLSFTLLNDWYHWPSNGLLFCQSLKRFFKLIHQFFWTKNLKVFFLFLIWWKIKSKRWLCGVGTLCANAHYGASLLSYWPFSCHAFRPWNYLLVSSWKLISCIK